MEPPRKLSSMFGSVLGSKEPDGIQDLFDHHTGLHGEPYRSALGLRPSFWIGGASALDLSGTLAMRFGRGICQRSTSDALAGDAAAVGGDFNVVIGRFKLDDPNQEALFDPDAIEEIQASADRR